MITRAEGDVQERREKYSALVERFGTGWEKMSSKLMAEVFTDDGVLVPDPFGTAVVGRPAIDAYWKDIPFEQSEISFRFGEIFIAGPWFSTEFKCTFRRRRTGETVDVRGALFCETDGARISEMRMYWERRVGR